MRATQEAVFVRDNTFTNYPNIVLFVDLDDTLTDTAGIHATAALGLEPILGSDLGEPAAHQLVERFAMIFDELLQVHQRLGDDDEEKKSRGDEQIKRVEECQREIEKRWGGIKKFSREVLLHLAAEDVGIRISAPQLDFYIDQYWQIVNTSVQFLPGAVAFTETASRHTARLYLMTSSDARLSLRPNGQFEYLPQKSEAFKQSRLRLLRDRGLRYVDAVVGDPIDKPNIEFFEKVRHLAGDYAGSRIDSSQIVLIGDSYSSDMEEPLSIWGDARAVLLKIGQEHARLEGDRLVSIGDLHLLSDALDLIEIA